MSRRRRTPWIVLAVLFVVVPLVEIYLLVQLGQVIGAWWTILLLVAAGVLGSYLVRREGRRAWRALQQALSSGRMPARELADGALILVGGTLLVTPGFMSDVVGLFAILPFTRPLARRALAGYIARRMTRGGPLSGGPLSGGPRPGGPTTGGQADWTGPTPRRTPPGSSEVVTGEVVEDD